MLALSLALTGCGGASVPVGAPEAPAPVISTMTIMKIGVQTELVRLGLNPDGGHEVPPLGRPEMAGWYTLGVAPGDIGPAVILGHVNGSGRPGIFADLHRLEPGDLVGVERDGFPVVFAVYDVLRVDKDAYPGERVYGDTAGPELRLVTCGGVLDRSTGHYEDNLIVFARAVLE